MIIVRCLVWFLLWIAYRCMTVSKLCTKACIKLTSLPGMEQYTEDEED